MSRGALSWLDELPLEPEPPDMRVGLRRIDARDWLALDHLSEAELELRIRLLDQNPDHVQLLGGYEAAAEELLGDIERAVGAAERSDRGINAVRRSAVIMTEDHCLLAPVGGTWTLVGGALLFPNYWTIAEKLSGSLSEIHAPTEGYESMLAGRVDRFFDRLVPGTAVRRRNWFLNDDNSYSLAEPKPTPLAVPTDHADSLAHLTIRSERQTLRRLDRNHVVVFTIKTQMVRMDRAIEHGNFAARLMRWAETATPRAQRLKGTAGRHDALIAFLAASGRPGA